jgi:hypothetical protein
VLELVAEDAEPGEEGERPGPDGEHHPDVGCLPAADGAHRQHGQDDGHQVQRPVVQQHQRRRDRGHRHQPPGGRALEGPGHRQVPEQREQRQQRVHAVLGGVAHGERGGGQDEGDRPGRPGTAEAAAGHPGHRQGGHGDHAGERPHGGVAVAHHGRPEVEQPVVEGREPVVAEGVGDLVERQRGDRGGQRLVQPQLRAGEEAERHGGAEDGHHEGAEGGARPRAFHCEAGQLPAATVSAA